MPARCEQPGLVSVVTPCHDVAPFIAATIASVVAQRYTPVEHIVVDDASTDGTWAEIARFSGAIRSVRLLENRGGSHARNVGAALAGGDYLLFLDADDLIAPDTLGALVNAVQAHPRTIGVCPWQRLVRTRHDGWRPAPARMPFPPPPDPLRGWLEGAWVPPCAVLWRRDAYDQSGGWDEELVGNQDGDIAMRALARGVRLVAASSGEAYYRTHGASRLSVSGSTFSERSLRSRMRVLEKLTAELTGAHRFTEYAEPVGVAYQRLARLGFQRGYGDLARECLRRGEQLAGRRAVARTWPGRLLTRWLGVEAKERVVEALAAVGIMTPGRRQMRALRRLHRQRSVPCE